MGVPTFGFDACMSAFCADGSSSMDCMGREDVDAAKGDAVTLGGSEPGSASGKVLRTREGPRSASA